MSELQFTNKFFVKKILNLFIVLISCTLNSFAQEEIKRCANEVLEQRNINSAKYQSQKIALENAIQAKLRQYSTARVDSISQTQDKIVKIPVVVHVIHNVASNNIGEGGNISVDQINAQIRILNEDYRKKINTNGYNTNKVGADIEIEFYLATIDPNETASTGITRTYNAKVDFSVLDDRLTLANIVAWPSNRYLNMWVTKLQGRYLGYGQFPSVDVGKIDGLNTDTAADTKIDGFFVDYRYFGDRGAVTSVSYGLGRTATHEIGHWLGLFHTWGDQFCGTDYCDDTPICQTSNSTTSCNTITSKCDATTTTNMIENYMDYSPDRCMNIFTECQKKRMRAVLDVAPRRKQLIDFWNALPEANNLTVTIEPSIIQSESVVKILLKGTQTIDIQLVDNLGRKYFQDQLVDTKSVQYPLNVSVLPNGKYYLQVKSATECVTPKLLVIK